MESTDNELLSRYRAGDVDALEVLVQRHKAPLFGYILGMTGGRSEADDVFQDVWFKVIRKLDRYRHKNFRGWLVRIAHNVIIDRARKKTPAVSLDANPGDGWTLANVLPGPGRDPEAEAEAKELGRRLAEAVSQLPPEQREVFMMRSQMDMKFKEIAGLQGVSINTALARMQYAVGKLRSLLEKDYAELNG